MSQISYTLTQTAQDGHLVDMVLSFKVPEDLTDKFLIGKLHEFMACLIPDIRYVGDKNAN